MAWTRSIHDWDILAGTSRHDAMDGFRQILFLSLTLFAWTATADLAWPQEARATLGGRVTDPQGAVIPSAVVVVTSDATGVEQRTKTGC